MTTHTTDVHIDTEIDAERAWIARHLGRAPWLNFRRISNEKWFHDNIVLMGDAAHTAHFSIGSGTKLALEDAIGLAEKLHDR